MGRYSTQECQPYQQECQPAGYCDSGSNQCYPSNSDMQAFQGCRSRGGCASGSDGFQIVQGCEPFASPEAYNAAVSGTFLYTEQNYNQALRDAAAKGQPVIAVFGGEKVPNSRGMIEDVKRAQAEGVTNATYVYIDMDKLAQNPSVNPSLAAYVDGNIRGHNLAHAIMFAQKPDAAGNPVPERNIMSTWGGVQGNAEMLKDQLQYGLNAMRGREFNVKPSDTGVAPADQAAPKKSNAEIFKDIQAGIEAGKKATDWREGNKDFMRAIQAADRMQPEVNASLAAANTDLQAATKAGDKARVAEVNAKIAELQKYKDAAAQARMEYGFQMMKWNPNFKSIGEQWLMAAGDRNPGIFEDPNFSARMKEAGYSRAAEHDFAVRMQERDAKRNRNQPGSERQTDVGSNVQPPANQLNPPPNRHQLSSKPAAIMRPNPNGPNPGEFRPAVTPETTPPEQRPPEQRERRPQPERERPRPQPDSTEKIPRLLVGHQGEARAKFDEMEYNILAKAADENKELKTAWGRPGCGYCPPNLAAFERSANDSKSVYYSNHDFNRSGLAAQIGVAGGPAPQRHEFRVERISDTDFRLTDRSGNSRTVHTKGRRR